MIKDLINDGETKELIVIVKEATQRLSNRNTYYLNLIVQDVSGEVVGKIWNPAPEDLSIIKPGLVLKIQGIAQIYNGETQLKILKNKIITNYEQYLHLLVAEAPIDVTECYEKMFQITTNFKNKTLKTIVLEILKQYEKAFKIWPAAVKMHHAVKGGLVWHTYTMLEMAQNLSKIYFDRTINWELLYAGVMLHDIGKLEELNYVGVANYNLAGNLNGHIVIGATMVDRSAIKNKIPVTDDIVILLKHLILASHGKYEYGSPVLPKTIEAEILHQLDDLDAKIFMIDKALSRTTVGSYSFNLMGIDNKTFYCHE